MNGREIDLSGPESSACTAKFLHLDIKRERFEAPHATQFHRLSEGPINPKRAFRNSHLERVTKRPSAACFREGRVADMGTLFLALQMEAISGNLA